MIKLIIDGNDIDPDKRHFTILYKQSATIQETKYINQKLQWIRIEKFVGLVN